MNRRDCIKLSALLLPAVPGSAAARLACTPFFSNGVQQCEAGILASLAHIRAQHGSQWCWAACIEMIFKYHGYSVSQSRIVEETWGNIVDMPADPIQILSNLNRDWEDDDGEEFSVSGDVFTSNPITAAQDLAADQPLIIGTMGHAMVLTSLVYARNAYGGGQVMSAIVRDPWPGRGRRILTAPEWYGTGFLARIRVS